MNSSLIATGLALAVLCSSCVDVEDTDTIDAAFSQALSSAEQDGVLRFVNDCPTTLSVLDDDAALDVRAATRIVRLRDGADATCGTADDQLFQSMTALDDVPWVGNWIFEKDSSGARIRKGEVFLN